MKSLTVNLAERSYPITIGPGALAGMQERIAGVPDVGQVAVIADRHVADLHLPALMAVLPTETGVLVFEPGEESKTLGVVEELCEHLADAGVERRDLIVAFGGGVAGDLAGFIAAVWLRGVRFIQVPTTLLAAVDASVGGKTGVNLAGGKNLVGAFHQPQAVIIDTELLSTLSERDYAAGMAESVKHATIRDPALLAWHETHLESILARDAQAVEEMIARSCEIKAAVVAADERETDLRAVLNHGHTIGHAIEHLLEYELRHGECVALGTLVENEIAGRRGWLEGSEARRINALLARIGLPMELPRVLEASDVWAACRVDKKARGGNVNFILLRGVGQPVRVADVTESEVAAALNVIQPGGS